MSSKLHIFYALFYIRIGQNNNEKYFEVRKLIDNKSVYKKGNRLKIYKSDPLAGECEISTSKNAVLPILAACLLTKEPVVIRKIPHITDVNHMIVLLKIVLAPKSKC